MTSRTAETSPRKTARVAGFLYLIIIILGIFAIFFIPFNLIVPGDATATANNIMASESLFRVGIASNLIVFTAEVLLALALYVLLKPVNKNLALLAMFLRLVEAAILGINLLNHFFALLLLSGADYLRVFQTDQLHALVLLFLRAHSYGHNISEVFFGLGTIVLGYLFFKSKYVPRIMGVLLSLGGLVYLMGSFAIILAPNYEAIISPAYLLPFVAELSLALWLLIKGVNVEQWKKSALESA